MASESASAAVQSALGLVYTEGKIEGMRAVSIVSGKQQLDHVDIENATGLTTEDLKSALVHMFESQQRKRTDRMIAAGVHPLHIALADSAMARVLSETKLDDLGDFPGLYAEVGTQVLFSLRALETLISAVRDRVHAMFGASRVETAQAAKKQRVAKAAVGKRGVRKSARLAAKTN